MNEKVSEVGSSDISAALTEGEDGKILAAGNSGGPCVIRYTSNGLIGSSFAIKRILRIPEHHQYEFSNDIFVMAKGRHIFNKAFVPAGRAMNILPS